MSLARLGCGLTAYLAAEAEGGFVRLPVTSKPNP